MTSFPSVRDARASDIPTLAAVIHGIGPFTPDEAEGFAASLPGHFEGGAEDRDWLVAAGGMGAAYLSPEPSPGVWNLLSLGVRPEAHRRGIARALIGEAERRLQAEGARMLLIDTSTEPPMESSRALYAALGYAPVGLIPDHWWPSDGKLMVRKAL